MKLELHEFEPPWQSISKLKIVKLCNKIRLDDKLVNISQSLIKCVVSKLKLKSKMM